MALWVNDNGVWKETKMLWVNDNGVWKEVAGAEPLYQGGYFAGNITVGSTTYALVLSPIESGESPAIAWGPSDTTVIAADSRTDGVANTSYLAGLAGSWPAAEFCDGLTLNGYSDWYMPAIDELMLIFRNMAAVPEDQRFSAVSYWSSTDATDNIRALAMDTSGAQIELTRSLVAPRARAVRRVAV